MDLSILTSFTLDREKWQSLVESSGTSSFYQTYHWSVLWEASLDCCTTLYCVRQNNSEYLMGLPLIRIRKKKLDSYFSMPMGSYGGLIYRQKDESLAQGFIRDIFESIGSCRNLRFQVVDYSGQSAFLERLGLLKTQATTQVVDLDSVNRRELLDKRGFQQAAKKGLVARKIASRPEVEICYQLYRETCKRHQIGPKYPPLFYANIFDLGKDSDWLFWWLAELDGEILAYQINFAFKDRLLLWDAGSRPESLSLRPNDLLMGQSLKGCQENQIMYYNLGGTPPGAEGLRRFKEIWGGRTREYQIYEKSYLLGKFANLWRKR
jgi:CelD/BcsL family acetyltransferase involved in cellulose biosynthesis